VPAGVRGRDDRWRRRLDAFACRNGLVLLAASCLLGSLVLSSSAKFAVGIGYSLNAVCIAILL
jgi:hypothetical protein